MLINIELGNGLTDLSLKAVHKGLGSGQLQRWIGDGLTIFGRIMDSSRPRRGATVVLFVDQNQLVVFGHTRHKAPATRHKRQELAPPVPCALCLVPIAIVYYKT